VRDRILEFGGYSFLCVGHDGATRAFDLSSNSGWSEIAPQAAPAPGPSAGVLDTSHHEFVVVQGDQVWRMPLEVPGVWIPVRTIGGGAKAFERQDAISEKAVYDLARDRILVFTGGMVRALSGSDPAAWTEIIPVPPDLGSSYTATYDPSQDRVIVIGPSVYVLSLAPEPNWSLVIAPDLMPINRSGNSAIYDPTRYRIVVFGGYDESGTEHNDIWALALDNFQWSQISPTNDIQPRIGHQAVYDPTRDRMLVWNGESYYCCGFFPIMYDAESLSFADNTWQMESYGASPCTQAAAVYDQSHDRILVVGGQTYPSRATSNCQQAMELNLGGVVSVEPGPRGDRRLALVTPNPSRGLVWFRFTVSVRQPVLISLFDMRGRLMRTIYDAICEPGAHSVPWGEGQSLAPGSYIYSISMGDESVSGKLVKVR